jgi:CheY-specific phosphatase CheX
MLSIITKAATNFCEHQIRTPYTFKTTIPKMRIVLASIEIVENDKVHTVYLGVSKELLQSICKVFLFEDESDDETLEDMLLETTNMIVGSAKVLAQETSNAKVFNIKTPVFLETKRFNHPCDAMSRIVLDNGTIFIAIKE